MRRKFSTVAGTGCGIGVCGKLRHVHCHKCGVEAKNHVIYFRGTTPRTLSSCLRSNTIHRGPPSRVTQSNSALVAHRKGVYTFPVSQTC